jgi:hypothetical protein
MKAGLTLTNLAKELDRQNAAKRDFLVDTRELTLLPPAIGQLPPGTGGRSLEDTDVEPWMPELHLPEGTGEFVVRGVAPRQIGDHLKIPARFWDLMAGEHPALLAHNVNTLLRERPSRRMVRCLDFGDDDGGRYARAFLSDRYLRRDNYEVAQAALKVLSELPEVQIPTSQITDKHLYITALAPRVQGEVKAGDVVQAGVRIKNSEVGWGALSVEPILYRLWCSNGCGTWEKTRIFHLGSQLEGEETVRVLSDETLALDDKAFFAKLADVMRAAVDETKFNDFLVKMREAAATTRMAKPQEAMQELGKKFNVSETEGESILGHLIEGGDLTAYGALNAFTRAAQDVESYDRSMELEDAGGKILAMAGTREWERIAAA